MEETIRDCLLDLAATRESLADDAYDEGT